MSYTQSPHLNDNEISFLFSLTPKIYKSQKRSLKMYSL